MHVVFVSCCEKKAIKRTRAILDSYAKRTGDRTWLTPITLEGLAEVRKALRVSATRQTSIACFRNDGRKRMLLLWVVGSGRNFDKTGTSPVASRTRNRGSVMPAWARICALIAETAGFMHDLGKFNQEFQDKLNVTNKAIKDNVRHEWLSMFLANLLIERMEWKAAADRIENKPEKFSDRGHKEDTLVFKKHLSSIFDVLLYCIATHHKLPCKEEGADVISSNHHVNFGLPFANPKIPFEPSKKLMELIQRNIKKLRNFDLADIAPHAMEEAINPVYWRAIATFSRMALILADQSVSAIVHPPAPESDDSVPRVYANTHGTQRNQDLSWHLENVGLRASQMIFNILNISLPSLSQDAIDNIRQPACQPYEWQNVAAFALSGSRIKGDVPHLVLNMAGTGSGKTRMNLRAICALSEDKPIRVATALNLRTLTLQTSDAYQKQVGIKTDEMACVIGDSFYRKLHESGLANADEDEDEYDVDVAGDFDFDMPHWLKFYADKNPKLGDIIGAPVLVSTIDFLIAAGEPHRKHHHILAAMRVMHSDLILDEIDGYEPMALLSVLRLVTLGAMFGRNVVASSATLSKPVARMLWQAYQHGAEMRGLLNKEPIIFKTAIIDDLHKPFISSHHEVERFMDDYVTHVEHMMRKLKGHPYRVPALARIEKKDKAGWQTAIGDWAKLMHQNHAWVDGATGKSISIGLVRVANITTAVEVAQYLSKRIANSKVVCYHSNHFPMQRFHIERRLDFLLARKAVNPNKHILDDTEIRQILDGAEGDVQLIVVATPVEEIGRDHDFDWAIIEPSSSQSIVQTAGRVNRHRLVRIPADQPNVAILQYCYREVTGNECVFTKPGLEMMIASPAAAEQSSHSSHDLSDLFDWSRLDQIDARMRFCSDIHPFAEYDDKAIEEQSKRIMNSMLTIDNLWMARETYTESRLRDFSSTIELGLDNPDFPKEYKVSSKDILDGREEKATIDILEHASNEWLTKRDEELIADAQERGMHDKKAMTVSISYFCKNGQTPAAFVRKKVSRHLSFGFFIRPERQ